jgi:hypothetical protein
LAEAPASIQGEPLQTITPRKVWHLPVFATHLPPCRLFSQFAKVLPDANQPSNRNGFVMVFSSIWRSLALFGAKVRGLIQPLKPHINHSNSTL